jgi:hypothetical protein
VLPEKVVLRAFEDGGLELIRRLVLEVEQGLERAQAVAVVGREEIRSPGPTSRTPSAVSTVALPSMMK